MRRLRPSESAPPDKDLRTVIEATPDGWWYTAVVPSGERVVAFLTDNDLADRVAMNSASGFLELLAKSRHVIHFVDSHGYRLDADPRGADAGTARLGQFGGPGWLAVGDAALSFDPLSSQGILNALYMGLKAGQAIAGSFSGNPGGVDEYLRRVESIYNAYRTNRNAYYAAEGRWRDRPFWRRRIGS